MLCEIPIPDGWEFVGYRKAETGERSFERGKITEWNASGSSSEYIIIRKQWQPPDFLPDGWIAKDVTGMWYWYGVEPSHASGCWSVLGGQSIRINLFIWGSP